MFTAPCRPEVTGRSHSNFKIWAQATVRLPIYRRYGKQSQNKTCRNDSTVDIKRLCQHNLWRESCIATGAIFRPRRSHWKWWIPELACQDTCRL